MGGVMWSLSRFNPRLPLLGGDARRIRISDHTDAVSIHASRCWEAMRQGVAAATAKPHVSIHASRCWEAMPVCEDIGGCQSAVSIHASRCWEAMPCKRSWRL